MATIMEKDILLEYAQLGHLTPKNTTEEIEKDCKKMWRLRRDILKKECQDIDFDSSVNKIKELRNKYEYR